MNEKIYSKDEVLQKTLEYFNGDSLAANVWINKYALKDSDGNIYEKTPNDMHHRIAKELARIEKNYPNPMTEGEIFETIKNFKYIIPQGSPMNGIGNDFQVSSLSNCFVIGSEKDKNGNYEDSYGSILKTDQELIQLCKRRAGVGTTLEFIRPNGSPVKNAALTSTGVVPFMERYSNSIREVAQCLHGDTLVLTNKGLKKIKDIQIGDFIWTNKGFIKNLNILKNKKPMKKVVTKFGNEIVCSEDHIFNTINGEIVLKDLKINDEINIIAGIGWTGEDIKMVIPEYKKSSYNNSNRLNEQITLPEAMNENLSYFLGYSYGDGYVSKEYELLSLSLSNDWLDIQQKLENIISSEFTYDSKIINKEKYGKYTNLNIHSKVLINYLKENNILKQKTENIILPDYLYKCSVKNIFAFLSGYFDADGTVSKKKKNYKMSSVSKEFLLSIQNLLYSFGIISKIHTSFRKENNWKTLYNLTINGQKNQHKFYDLMSESVKINYYNRFYKKSDNLRTTLTIKDFDSCASKHSYIIDNKQYISYSTTDRLMSDLNFQKNIHLFQDYIFSIEPYNNNELQDTYDLSLESEHLFYANGFQVHNSGRRGALMLTTHIGSIDSVPFIDAKLDTTKVTGANISVKIDDNFMKCLESNEMYEQKYPLNSNSPTMTKMINPKEIWNKLIYNNWKCLPYDTELPIYDENGIYCIKKIGEIVKQKNKNYKVLSLNLTTLKIEKKSILDYQEYNNNKNIYELKTKRKKSLKTTEDHIVYIFRDENVISLPISKVKEGDYIIVSDFNRFIDNNDYNNKIKLNLSKFINSSVEFDDFATILNNVDIKNILGYYDKGSKISHYISNNKLPIVEFNKIKHLINIKNLKVTRGNQSHLVEFEIDNNIMSFIGLWLAEGSYHNSEVLFYIHKNELESYKKLFNNIANKFNINWSYHITDNYAKVTFSSSFLKNFLESIDINYINREKHIPEWIFSLSLNNIAAFLKGIFSGDGTKSKVISFSQSNKNIIDGVYHMLLMFGINSKVYIGNNEGKKIINGKLCNIKTGYKIDIYKESNILYDKYISFFMENKILNSKDINTLKDSYTIPLSNKMLNKLQLCNRKSVSKKLLLERLKKYSNIKIDKNFIINDINYDLVVSNKKIEKCNKVYDITVKDNHTFVLSNGCVVSNSAEPGILFWDTIIKESVPDCYKDYGFESIGTNPCLVGDTDVITNNGIIKIKDIYDNFSEYKKENLMILSYNIEKQIIEYKELNNAWLTKKNANIIELELENGTKIKLTPNHKCYTKNRGWIEAAKLNSEDILLEIED